MLRRKLFVAALLLSMLLIGGSSAAGDAIIVSLKSTECPWADSHLNEKVDVLLTSMNRVPIIRQVLPESPEAMSFEETVLWGQQQGGRYLVDIKIDRINLEQRKATVLPWIVHRYRVFAMLEGTLRIIDLKKGRLLDLQPIACELKASEKFQVVDDDKTDADLLIPADEKQSLFDNLEQKAAGMFYHEIKKLTRGNHFDG